MINVAFFCAGYSKEWMGGINYISNLLYAISQLEDKQVKPIVFLGLRSDSEIKNKFSLHAQVVQDSLFDARSVKWYVHKIIEKIFNKTPLLNILLKKYDVKVISHSTIKHGCNDFVIINWIPDFQHVHLPDFFTKKENKKRNIEFLKIFKKSDCVIVSSYHAYDDAVRFSPENIKKLRVLQFVSQPNDKVFSLSNEHIIQLEKKYAFKGKFFFLPNQFWEHKNHMVIFKAVKELKAQGVNVLVLCSGNVQDYRNPLYIEEVKNFIKENNLELNIKILGLIDYDDVLYFMKFSIAVINPSLFEGWSSTVEECKSIGKNMLLSDIEIHREQNPANSLYFDPSDKINMVKIMKKSWEDRIDEKNNELLENSANKNLIGRTLSFAKNYQCIVLHAVTNTLKH